MPSLSFSFTGVADPNGVIHIKRDVPVGPIRIKITQFSLRTSNGCDSRIHDLNIYINDNELYRGTIHDCAELTIQSRQSWRGVLHLHFTAGGFIAGEQIAGSGAVEFHAALL